MTDLFGGEDTPQSKGGRARADALPPERRKEIAKAAAAARWQEDLPKVVCGSVDRPMRIPALGIEIPCYVIEGERRVIVQSGMITALGMTKGGSSHRGGTRLSKFVSSQRLGPYASQGLVAGTQEPILFRTPSGAMALGFEATILADICDMVLAARQANRLQKQQEHIAERAEILLRAFARGGIVSLVDEATGYQYIRAKNAIEQLIDKWLVRELQPWKKHFPIDYYRRIHELHNWPFDPLSAKHPGVVGKWTNDIVYDRLGPGLREQLHDFAGRDEKGRLKHVLTRFLTTDHGIPALKSHFDGIVALMRAAGNWRQFTEMLDRAFPKPQTTLKMALDDLDRIGK